VWVFCSGTLLNTDDPLIDNTADICPTETSLNCVINNGDLSNHHDNISSRPFEHTSTVPHRNCLLSASKHSAGISPCIDSPQHSGISPRVSGIYPHISSLLLKRLATHDTCDVPLKRAATHSAALDTSSLGMITQPPLQRSCATMGNTLGFPHCGSTLPSFPPTLFSCFPSAGNSNRLPALSSVQYVPQYLPLYTVPARTTNSADVPLPCTLPKATPSIGLSSTCCSSVSTGVPVQDVASSNSRLPSLSSGQRLSQYLPYTVSLQPTQSTGTSSRTPVSSASRTTLFSIPVQGVARGAHVPLPSSAPQTLPTVALSVPNTLPPQPRDSNTPASSTSTTLFSIRVHGLASESHVPPLVQCLPLHTLSSAAQNVPYHVTPGATESTSAACATSMTLFSIPIHGVASTATCPLLLVSPLVIPSLCSTPLLYVVSPSLQPHTTLAASGISHMTAGNLQASIPILSQLLRRPATSSGPSTTPITAGNPSIAGDWQPLGLRASVPNFSLLSDVQRSVTRAIGVSQSSLCTAAGGGISRSAESLQPTSLPNVPVLPLPVKPADHLCRSAPTSVGIPNAGMPSVVTKPPPLRFPLQNVALFPQQLLRPVGGATAPDDQSGVTIASSMVSVGGTSVAIGQSAASRLVSNVVPPLPLITSASTMTQPQLNGIISPRSNALILQRGVSTQSTSSSDTFLPALPKHLCFPNILSPRFYTSTSNTVTAIQQRISVTASVSLSKSLCSSDALPISALPAAVSQSPFSLSALPKQPACFPHFTLPPRSSVFRCLTLPSSLLTLSSLSNSLSLRRHVNPAESVKCLQSLVVSSALPSPTVVPQMSTSVPQRSQSGRSEDSTSVVHSVSFSSSTLSVGHHVTTFASVNCHQSISGERLSSLCVCVHDTTCSVANVFHRPVSSAPSCLQFGVQQSSLSDGSGNSGLTLSSILHVNLGHCCQSPSGSCSPPVSSVPRHCISVSSSLCPPVSDGSAGSSSLSRVSPKSSDALDSPAFPVPHLSVSSGSLSSASFSD